ncbi:hypothetical protein [Variovorax paradoxus]|uniref:hypothetical protein n=1 Tax=Variovorax paradoxus TaxID=34073 RepID=UPI001934035B|nr:hypothetical protein INQ48_08065 [Variovorax paradoxus]
MTFHPIRCLAGALALASLGGCIVLPPPVAYGPPPPPMAARMAMPGPMTARLAPPPAWDMCEGEPEGARPVPPGPRGDALAGRCERTPSGALEYRPGAPR